MGGGRHGEGLNKESITNVGIAYLRKLITPILIDSFKALARCTCQEKGPDVDDALKTSPKIVGGISSENGDGRSQFRARRNQSPVPEGHNNIECSGRRYR